MARAARRGDASLIRLHASPARLKQKLVPGAHLTVVTDDKGTPPAGAAEPAADDAALAQQFLARLTGLLGAAAARSWLRDASLERVAGDWCLLVGTRFTADWVRRHFELQVRQAAAAAGLAAPPAVQARQPPAPST